MATKTDTRNRYSLGVPAMLNAQEAATFLGISIRYLYDLTSQRKLPYYKPMRGRNSRLYFDKKELLKWLKSRKIEPKNEQGG